MSDGHKLPTLVLAMKDWERRTAVVVHGIALRDSQRSPNVPLPE
jgi:hypothetical protein